MYVRNQEMRAYSCLHPPLLSSVGPYHLFVLKMISIYVVRVNDSRRTVGDTTLKCPYNKNLGVVLGWSIYDNNAGK